MSNAKYNKKFVSWKDALLSIFVEIQHEIAEEKKNEEKGKEKAEISKGVLL